MKEFVLNIQYWLKGNDYAACIVPQADPHQSEYIEDYYKLRGFISGFTGSAGTLVITRDKAALFTDSRYHIQASIQLKDSGISLFKCGLPDVPTYSEWAASQSNGGKVAANAFLFSAKEWEKLSESINICNDNGFESVWKDRPALCASKIFIHDEKFSGESIKSKLQRVRDIMGKKNADIALICNLDDIAWLLNIRGADVEYNPVVRSYVAITPTRCLIFVDSNKIEQPVADYFRNNGIETADYGGIGAFIEGNKDKTVLLDKGNLNYGLFEKVKLCKDFIDFPLFISHLRAVKNTVEIEGYRSSMIKDGVVWVKFYKWFTESLKNNETISEISVMDKLRELKSVQKDFIDESFGTIAGYAEHGAIGHYAANAETDSKIEHKGFLVIDTGTHYLDGTTDTTRTMVCGSLSDDERHDYTLVLKGHIALGTAVFPKGTKGSQLDILARQYLWQSGMNYGHGTGHGVGHLLNVHEGYAWLRPSENNIGYEPWLTMTDEPGIYREGKYGIRIENTVLVKPYKKTDFGEFLTFEHLTIAPYAMSAIDVSMLTNDEKNFINNYNRNMCSTLSPYLTDEEFEFLKTIAYEI
ncbi:MAG: aminopeptidase P family protein [Paludibacteraceae bacterium]|nr:aminopeptidase P family protein [Paludibacteraceae bacterium]